MRSDASKQDFTPRIDFLVSFDEHQLLEELKRIAALTGKETVTKEDLETHGRVSYSKINKDFGSLRAALQKAGLNVTRYMKATDNELIDMLLDLWEQVLRDKGRRPFRNDLKEYGFPISADTYVRRYGSWKHALIKAYESIGDDELDDTNGSRASTSARKLPKSMRLSLRKRFFVLKRDEFTCQMCGACGRGVRLEVDHRIPRAKGGSDALDNLQTLCYDCNRGKRDSLQ